MPRWTPEARAAQAARIRRQQPWVNSTGPRSAQGKARSSRNAFRHGFDGAAFLRLKAAFRRTRTFLKGLDTKPQWENSGGIFDIKENLTLFRLHEGIQIYEKSPSKGLNRDCDMSTDTKTDKSGIDATTKLASAFNLVRLYPQGWQSGSFRNNEGRDVYYARAEPVGPKIGTMVFTTGYADSINFHYDAIRNLQDRGYEVFAMDWIGQGLSDRENPTNIRDSNDRLLTRHMNDLHKFVTDVVPDTDTPRILVSHSMGGNVSMLYLKHFPQSFDGAILAAPMIDLNTSILPRSVFRGIASAATKLGFGDEPLPNWRPLLERVTEATRNLRSLSQDKEALTLSQQQQERMRSLLKPVEVDLPTWNFIRRSYHAMDEMRHPDFYDDIQTPVLLIEAGRDELVSNKAIRHAAEELPYGKLLKLPKSGHGVWNTDTQSHNELWDGIDSFVEDNIRSAPQFQRVPAPESSPVPARGQPATATAFTSRPLRELAYG